MKNWMFDVLMIIAMAALLTVIDQFGMLEEYAKYAMIPLVAFYFLGKYSERRLGKKA